MKKCFVCDVTYGNNKFTVNGADDHGVLWGWIG